MAYKQLKTSKRVCVQNAENERESQYLIRPPLIFVTKNSVPVLTQEILPLSILYYIHVY